MVADREARELFRKLEACGGDVFRVASELVPRPPARIDAVRCVLLHANSYGVGGLSRVVGTQCSVFRKLGIDVHLLLSSPIPEKHCPLPEDVEVHYLPKPRPGCVEDIRMREKALLEIADRTHADVYLDSAYLNLSSPQPTVLCDWMALRTATDVRVVLHWHNVFSRFFRQPDGLPFARNIASALRFCDGMIVLSRVDRRFFMKFGCRVWYLPNPIDDDLVAATQAVASRPRTGKTVLWCARLSDIKRPLSALQAFEVAHALVPESRLIMVGGGDANLLERMSRFVDEHGLRDCVTMTGELTNTYAQYAEADVFLSTSTCEGYPVSFVEAYAFSLPIISMGKGYLELLREGDGAVVVPADDAVAAGRAIADIIGVGERLVRKREAAAAAWRRLRDFDFLQAYSELFRDLVTAPANDLECDDEERLMINEIVAAVPVGFDAARNRDVNGLRQAGVPCALKVMSVLYKCVSLLLVGQWRRRVRARRNACRDMLESMEGCGD